MPEAQLKAWIGVSAELNLVIASAGVTGGIYATINFNLNDPNHDGKARVDELVANCKLSPIFVFDISGKLEAGLSAYVQLDLGVFKKRWERRLATVTLLNFNISRPESKPPPLAVQNGDVLTLSISGGPDQFNVAPGTTANTVIIQAQGREETFSGVKLIKADAGGGDDVITVQKGVTATVNFDGGAGNDRFTISGSTPAIFRGGAGDDELTGGCASDEIRGGDGNDTIYGNGGDDLLEGGAGIDQIYGAAGRDRIFGHLETGSGDENDADQLDGGEDADEIHGGGGNDRIFGRSGADQLWGDAGDDYIEGCLDGDTI